MGETRKQEWTERAGRIGYAAKGVVYVLIGWIALQAAVEASNRPQGSRDALQNLADAPLGRVLLAAIAAGLVAYVVWRWIQAFVAPGQESDDTGGRQTVKRIGYFISGVLYGVVAYAAARTLMNGGGDAGGAAVEGSAGGATGGGGRADAWTAMVMQYPLGRWLIAAVGALVIAYGIYAIYRAVAKDMSKRFDLTPLPGDTRPWVIRLGRFGVASRGVVFGVIGTFLIVAALQYDPQEARGLGGALQTLERQAYGSWLLALIGLGLIAYGVFQFAKARWRRIPA